MAALRSVAPGEKPPRKARAKTVTQAAKSGTKRELLVAMRDRIAIAVEDSSTPARELASLTKRLTEVVNAIEGLDARAAEEGAGGSAPDEAFDPSSI